MCAGIIPGLAQAPLDPEVVNHPSPLFEAAQRLGGRYAVPVTYEDAILLRKDETVLTGVDPGNPWSYEARIRPITIPWELTPTVTPKLNKAALGKLIDAFYATNPNGPRFRIEESKHGWHILPDSVRDERGQFVSAVTPLDAVVSVPAAERLVEDHLGALVDALTRATGIEINQFTPDCNRFYAANGLMPPKALGLAPELSTLEAKRPYSFSWGANGVTGRGALRSLLEGSATTLAWYVTCHSQPAHGKSVCGLSVVPLVVTVTGADGRPERRSLTYDRCTKCPPLPPPPPAARR
jgi:hypothetical protein